MTIIYDRVHRLESEPLVEDLARGFAAELADPAWMLGRQWQLGEHRGEDASSPVRVEYRPSVLPIGGPGGHQLEAPRLTPAEAIVESEPGDFWTAGRRVAIGRRVAAAAPHLPDDPTLLLSGLPAPYDVLDGSGRDGRVLWARRSELGLDPTLFGETPPEPEPVDCWSPAALAYNADFSVAERTLALRRHDGGALDWFSVDASGPLPAPAPRPDPVSVFPGRATYPGAPAARWWEIEHAKVDIGGYPPDRSHVATTLLIDLIASHSDDWFGFPVTVPSGHAVTLDDVVVHDSFGETWTLASPGDGWTLFSTAGLGELSLVSWATAATPLQGPVIDEIVLGVDEDANLVWAVERRVAGVEIPTASRPGPALPPTVDAGARRSFDYRPSSDVPPGWHPYVVADVAGRRRFVQARAADRSGAVPALTPEPSSDLLYDPAAAAGGPVHQMEPSAIPTEGLRLERRAMLARRTDGSPVLWRQRRTQPLLTPPALRLRWDELVAAFPAP